MALEFDIIVYRNGQDYTEKMYEVKKKTEKNDRIF